MPEVITLGETMICFTPATNESLQYAYLFEKRIAGAESNVAIAVSRLEHTTGWISKLGNDPFGRFIINTIRGEGVDVSNTKFDNQLQTALMYKQISDGYETQITYYRKNSAASSITPQDLNPGYFAGCKIFHSTGINAVISQNSFDTLKAAISMAKSHNCLISFDPNIRLKLCNIEEFRNPLINLIKQTDIILLGIDEAEILFGTVDQQEILDLLFGLGVQYIGLKLGDKGAVLADQKQSFFSPAYDVPKIDSVGAGDAFNAGFLAGLLEHKTLEECGQFGNAMGALAITSKGDFESLPTKQELLKFLNGIPTITR